MISFEEFQAALRGETPATPAATETQTSGAVEASGKSGLATKLEAVSGKAIDKLDELLGLPLDQDDPHFAGVLRAQTAAAGVALNTQVRTDETALRKQTVDRLPELLRLAEEVRARLPPRGDGRTIEGGGNGPGE